MRIVNILSCLLLFSFVCGTQVEADTSCGSSSSSSLSSTINVNTDTFATATEAEQSAQELFDQYVLDAANGTGARCETNTCEHNGGVGTFSCTESVGTSGTTASGSFGDPINGYRAFISFTGTTHINCANCPPSGPIGPIPL